MRIVILGIIMIVSLILDNACMPLFPINHGYASILLIFIIAYSIQRPKEKVILIAIIAGLLQDLYFGNIFGVNTLINMLICLVCSELGNLIIKRKIFMPVIITGLATIIKGVLIYVIMYIFRYESNIDNVLYIAICNMIGMIILYKPVYKLSKFLL